MHRGPSNERTAGQDTAYARQTALIARTSVSESQRRQLLCCWSTPAEIPRTPILGWPMIEGQRFVHSRIARHLLVGAASDAERRL